MDGGHEASDHAGWAHLGGGQECRACPICVLLQAVSSARPEVLGHLVAAGRELTAALQALLDASTTDAEEAQRPSPKVQRIDVEGA